jgi:ribosomal-protein-alanine N-acetyltransferase
MRTWTPCGGSTHVYEGFKRGTQYTFALRTPDTGAMIGAMGLRVNRKHNRAELGYWLAEAHWGQGLTTEAAASVVQFGFEKIGLHRILATHIVENPASGRVMQKIGMIKEGVLIDHAKKGNAYFSLVQYGITKSQFN